MRIFLPHFERTDMHVLPRMKQALKPKLGAALAVAILIGGTACVSSPMVPPASLNEARLAITAAEKDDARQYAGAELDEARQKFMLAEKAMASENLLLAERYADESNIMAQLATARTEASKAESINDEMRRSSKALAEEMQRVGDQQ